MSNIDFVFLNRSGARNDGIHDFMLQKFWFRSVEKYASWFHHIYFVTSDEIPVWLKTDHEHVTLIHFRDLMPEKGQNTGNYYAASLNLHRIPELEENFVLFDGLVFFTRKVKENDFFEKENPLDYAIMTIPIAELAEEMDPHVAMNNAGMINEHFDKSDVMRRFHSSFFSRRYKEEADVNHVLEAIESFPGFMELPVPHSMKRSCFEHVWSIEKSRLEQCSRRLLPDKADFNYSLFRAWNICEGNFIPAKVSNICCCDLGDDQLRDIKNMIRRKKYKMIGFTDHTNDAEFEISRIALQEALEFIFPKLSSFEKTAEEIDKEAAARIVPTGEMELVWPAQAQPEALSPENEKKEECPSVESAADTESAEDSEKNTCTESDANGGENPETESIPDEGRNPETEKKPDAGEKPDEGDMPPTEGTSDTETSEQKEGLHLSEEELARIGMMMAVERRKFPGQLLKDDDEDFDDITEIVRVDFGTRKRAQMLEELKNTHKDSEDKQN